jgi:hypothetical protein
MKRILIACCLIFSTGYVSAGEPAHGGRKGRMVECVCLCDVAQCATEYFKEVGHKMFDGTKTIVTAPFKAKICLPRPRLYYYQPPVFKPGKLTPLESLPKTNQLHPPRVQTRPVVGFTMMSW